jgi:hypothetical protein
MLSVAELFGLANLRLDGSVQWNLPVPETGPGVYVVSVADPVNVTIPDSYEADRDRWLPDQAVIYIGRSKGLRKRIGAFYRHKHGARKPHSGGQSILLVDRPKTVHWAAAADYAHAEDQLIEAFKSVAGRLPFGNRLRSAKMAEQRCGK